MGAQKTTAVYVGIFVIAGLVIMMWLSLKVGNLTIGAQTYDVQAEFSSVLGLDQGNPVTLRGVEIGRIGQTTFDPETQRPRVALKIDTQWTLRENAIARIVQPNLLGQRSVDIIYPDEGPMGRELANGDSITTRDAADLAEVLSEIGSTLDGTLGDFRDLAQSLNENQDRALNAITSLVEDNRPRVESILERIDNALPQIEETAQSISDVARSIREGRGLLGRLVSDETLASDIQIAASNLREISERIGEADGTLWRLLEEDDLYNEVSGLVDDLSASAQSLNEFMGQEDGPMSSLGDIAAALDEAMPDLRAAAQNLREVSAKINNGTGTIGLLVNDPALYHELRATLARVNETFEEAEETGVVRTFLAVFFGAFI